VGEDLSAIKTLLGSLGKEITANDLYNSPLPLIAHIIESLKKLGALIEGL